MLYVWRHPKAIGAGGRCIGRTDLAVDPRRAKRLAHGIRRHARRHALAHEVWTSPLRRGADVGRWLARWGWHHRIDAALAEIDFGVWDGLTWDEIGESAVTAWCADFARYCGHGGESVSMLFDRCAGWIADASGPSVCCVVGHAGWINAARLMLEGRGVPSSPNAWPPPLAHARKLELRRGSIPSDYPASGGGP
ncbi:MAG: histidine phosphatase family protein [Burkholderiaceae bacterium]|nr:histidine phosphatase family protein [Burkholderiaceae bacterium]